MTKEGKLRQRGTATTAETVEDREGVLLGEDSAEEPAISVVMPTMNEEEGIVECIERAKSGLREAGLRGEVIVSDSSTDRTPELAREHGAIVVEPDGKGYGYAYRYAFERTRGEFVVMGDANTTYDFEQIPRLLEPVENGHTDMVMGTVSRVRSKMVRCRHSTSTSGTRY